MKAFPDKGRASVPSERSEESEEVELRRVVWGDHAPRLVGRARSKDELLDLIRSDWRDRFGSPEEARIGVYSCTFAPAEDDEDNRNEIVEMIIYGSFDKIEEAACDAWDKWARNPADSSPA